MIELKDLQKIVEQHTVIDIEELRVESGEIVALFGPADSGIDMLLELLIGRQAPSAGGILLAGTNPWVEKERTRRLTGVLFAEDGLYKGLSPLGNLEFNCQLYNLPRQRAAQVLRRVGLADHAHASMKKLSSGLLRRLAFGRTILHAPQVLLLQEPFARCDEATINLISSLIHSEADQGAAVLILASSQSHLTSLCDRLYYIQDGKISEVGSQQGVMPERRPFKIPVKTEDTVLLLNPSDILYAEAREGRSSVVTLNGVIQTQFTLAELEERLSRSGFFRAHRSYLVNLQHVKEVIPYTRNSFSLRMDDGEGTKIPLSKAAAVELRDLLGY
jgi:ABC-2 type transport system ATP-binding protein